VWVQGDAARLQQVFVNLLSNAAKYTDSSGDLMLAVRQRERHAEVCLRDSGIGIAADELPHIFDLYRRAEPGASGSRAGLGIGLALVRTVVGLHGGTVRASSAGLGQGSEFIVRLPAIGPGIS
jgi:signal transduction histidine kinase